MTITNNQYEEALLFLIDTDQAYAHARANIKGLEKQERTILATAFLMSTRKTDKQKEAESRISPEYLTWRTDLQNATYEYEILRSKRITNDLIIEVWRSELSARKLGMII